MEAFQFESLLEDEEDFNVIKKDGSREYIQIKKKNEGYNWTPSELKKVFEKFYEKDKEGTSFTFVTNAGGNLDVSNLKNYLSIIKSD